MAARTLNRYLIKLVRASGWFLFPLMVLYTITGYALCGKFGMAGWVQPEEALRLHQIFDVPLVTLFLLHSLPSMYLAVRRWRWTRRRTQA